MSYLYICFSMSTMRGQTAAPNGLKFFQRTLEYSGREYHRQNKFRHFFLQNIIFFQTGNAGHFSYYYIQSSYIYSEPNYALVHVKIYQNCANHSFKNLFFSQKSMF